MAEVEAFRAYALDTPQTARTLYARLKKRKEDLSSQIADGYAADWGDYKNRVGVVDGLTIAMEICAEVVKEEQE